MTDHLWLKENLDAYLAGGLDLDERVRVEAHLADCADCALLRDQAKKMETYMTDLFPTARPDSALEDRAIARLRKATTSRPSWMRFVYAAAAVFALGMIGAAVQAVAMNGGLPVLGELRMASTGGHIRERGRVGAMAINGTYFGAAKEPLSVTDVDPAAVEFHKEMNYMSERLGDVSVPGAATLNDAIGIKDGDANSLGFYPPALAIDVKGSSRIHTGVTGGIVGGRSKRLEAAASLEERQKQEMSGKVFATPQGDAIPKFGGYQPDDGIPLGNDWGAQPAGASTGKVDGKLKPSDTSARSDQGKYGYMIGDAFSQQHGGNALIVKPSPGFFAPDKARALAKPPAYFNAPDQAKHDPAQTPPPAATPPKSDNSPPKEKDRDKYKDKTIDETLNKNQLGVIAKTEEAFQQEPADTGLKIIRTGEMEFQVDSFDNAVQSIVKLIKGVKGGFKLKEDSNKQPNGKTRGFVVVRMPPQFLDAFVLDLRRDLGKIGDLRTQRIGSQDVTKQYTDTESELRAARAVEGRLIEIIKTGKGEVKDLIAAERELGTWRTKIEKMEGEIRYYSNQVALSTLTINLVEKEIGAASALVVNAKVQMRIEVDNVTRARETAEKAVAELKGRLLKSDEKQHPAGQVEAILQAEIPPAQRSAFSAVLEKLGIVSAHEEAQTQTAEGGAGPVIDVKPRVNDVFFDVKLNNVVNIKPKHSIELDIATTEVSAFYAKLRDAILQTAKGQIRDGKLNEAEKQKSAAFLDFNVPVDKKAALDKVILEIGPVLKRENRQAALTEISTEQKFGYTVNLYSVGVIAPREEVALKVEVDDVKKKTAEVVALVRAAKGETGNPTFTLNPQGQTSALIKMRIPLSSNDAILRSLMEERRVVELKQAPNPNVPENELSTAQITMLLTDGNSIVPRDQGLSGYIRTSLYYAFVILAYIMVFVLTGLIVIVPCGIVIWVGYKAIGMMSSSRAPAPAAPKPPSEQPKA